MPEIIGNWLHFSGRQHKRKRAELVCVLCHSKKIKCDLQVSAPAGNQSAGIRRPGCLAGFPADAFPPRAATARDMGSAPTAMGPTASAGFARPSG